MRYSDLSNDQLRSIDATCEAFEAALRNATPLSIEDQIAATNESKRGVLFRELLAIELEWHQTNGKLPSMEAYCSRFPDRNDDIRQFYAEVGEEAGQTQEHARFSSPHLSSDTNPKQPEQIGRYRVEKLLGSGGFGIVYLAHDQNLNRLVAIKVPYQRIVSVAADAELYLSEARMVANLDHPNIVPVHDVGSDSHFPCYIVSKFIQGESLSTKMKQGRMSTSDVVDLVATIADALQHAHSRGLVHRDVKPSNILIDQDGKPYLMDFGLALREENIGSGPKFAGTPAYMSPEQARGEGHRVDGRSDVFSLGVVLYELLAGRPPFRGSTQASLLEQVIDYEPRPIRQYNERIANDLERICFKALSKLANDRYSTAHDMAVELRHYLADEMVSRPGSSFGAGTTIDPKLSANSLAQSVSDSSSVTSFGKGSDSDVIRIVPKGMRSFDEEDADFFLELLPGPRDRRGLPDSLRFWKTRIEQIDETKTFPVGLIFGPSGSGKSSLVKAGLLPILADHVVPVYLEATLENTEARLLDQLHRKAPNLPPNLNLSKSIASIRQGKGVSVGRKVLIVIDQFEQWLHAKTREESTELLQALRQCDGGRVQCIVMVRDDFWLAVSRFMRQLEVDLVSGKNILLVDLFEPSHARRVLRSYGQALGRLPESSSAITRGQEEFLKKAIEGLSQDGKVVCVRLALFAEMMKGKEWTPASLQQVGGIEGVGVTYLEEQFGASTANPAHRSQEKAARAVLKALLPESGIEIKGQMRSYAELLAVSEYAHQPQYFEALIRILDGELRLITPSDKSSIDDGDSGASTTDPLATRYYQLTHDYLVHSISDWLTKKQKETRRGRIELRLTELSNQWNASGKTRDLPTFWEWGSIIALTNRKKWTSPERRMMQKANRAQAITMTSFLAILFVVAVTFLQWSNSIKYRNLVDRTQTAVATMANSLGSIVPLAIDDLDQYPTKLVMTDLQERFANGPKNQQLAIAYALAHYGAPEVNFLVDNIKDVTVAELDNLAKALSSSKENSIAVLKSFANQCDLQKDWQTKHRYAVVELELGKSDLARDMCQLRSDPIQRTVFVDQFDSWLGDSNRLATLAKSFDDPGLCSAICLGIGSLPEKQLTEEAKQAWTNLFSEWFRNAIDSGTHGAADWALRKWNQPLPSVDSFADDNRSWIINSSGMTLIKIEPGSFHRKEIDEFTNFAPNSSLQKVIISHAIFMADREVTFAQFQQMIDDPDYPESEKPKDRLRSTLKPGQTNNIPALDVSFTDASIYCNWLSAKEGLMPAYEHTGEIVQFPTGQFAVWKRIANSNGYRLPTEAEWEYACRSGAETDYPFGDDVRFVQQYTVYNADRVMAGGSKFPNGWGLFDMCGNAFEWCRDWYGPYETDAVVTDPTGAASHPESFLVLRGGCFQFQADWVRTTSRTGAAFVRRSENIGFRVARTLAP